MLILLILALLVVGEFVFYVFPQPPGAHGEASRKMRVVTRRMNLPASQKPVSFECRHDDPGPFQRARNLSDLSV